MLYIFHIFIFCHEVLLHEQAHLIDMISAADFLISRANGCIVDYHKRYAQLDMQQLDQIMLEHLRQAGETKSFTRVFHIVEKNKLVFDLLLVELRRKYCQKNLIKCGR